MDYSKTVNLLQTDFPMKADLPVREPLMLKAWEESGLYERIQERHKADKTFLLHDGPPYANGDIHMGHALDKILKDFVVKYKSLAGFHAPYKPGWDCHGLPIEHQLFKQLGKNKHQISRTEFRSKATDYALTWVDKQRMDFIRLGVLGDWKNPYLTLSKDYEAQIVQVFFELQEKGFIERGLKPGYWCAFDETALAEAEVEYAEKKSDSVYVRFPLKNQSDHYILIWTTTPWTLPANTGLAFHPDENYVTVFSGSDRYIVAEKLKDKATSLLEKKFGSAAVQGPSFKGKSMLGKEAINPLHGRTSRVVNATYVTMEDGTGIVHIAPGHGLEDFAVGQEYKLETLSPVDERGLFDKTVGLEGLIGKHVLKDANQAVMESLGENLIAHHSFAHSYPHCWRCKNPIIFRATDQWFLKISDAFRRDLLAEIARVRWEPAYGVHRIKGMVEVRPDWCLSRQRHWGAPIAIVSCKACKKPINNRALNTAIVKLIESQGTNAWYEASLHSLLAEAGLTGCPHCGGTDFEKEMDILDVWFDSGVSWRAVVEKCFSTPKPETVMYLEGSDQHRGWFQTSLIPSMALNGKAPYDIVLTHGFVVDGKGHKMSKSLGNVIAPQEIIQKYGADILRLWVAMSDYREDVRLSQDIVKHMVDVYRRFRNTFRFLLQNTADFSWKEHHVPFEKMEEVDQWILVYFAAMKERVIKAYDAFEFHGVLNELNRFASVELSGFYLDALKDRLYCESLDSPLRRSAQTAFFHLTRGLSVLLSPLLSFTSEEAYLELRKKSEPSLPDSVFLEDIHNLDFSDPDERLSEKWAHILEVRGLVNDELDRQRKAGVLKSSQEALVTVDPSKMTETHRSLFKEKLDWPFILQMAEVHLGAVDSHENGIAISATRFNKCERCWRHRGDVGKSKDHPTICGRCENAVSGLVHH
ncbi:MAG: Isoleucine--tRNA ligase [Elusimicrobia bacterium]|nr:Isoleucine--tRNA ligase [Elusimicrobiota bacterium]